MSDIRPAMSAPERQVAELVAQRDLLLRRLAALDKPYHAITVVEGRCAICGREVYESGDYRGGRYRHELEDER